MKFELLMNIEEAQVLVEFDWYGTYEEGEPEWDTLKVHSLLPFSNKPEGKIWVEVTSLLSQDHMNEIEREIYSREDELRQQAIENEY